MTINSLWTWPRRCGNFSALVGRTINKKKAIREGRPYQTLISSLIHKYANDRVPL